VKGRMKEKKRRNEERKKDEGREMRSNIVKLEMN
jgi:hypothetical protein